MNGSQRYGASFPRPLAALLAQADVLPLKSHALPDITITSITADSRTVKHGTCFVAVRGAKSDGHHFVENAVKAGAACVVISDRATVPARAGVLRVSDTREALAKLSAAFYGLRGRAAPDMKLIGVTGTNGKSTVAWLIRAMLRESGFRPAMLGTIEYDLVGVRCPAPLTTPDPVGLCGLLARAREFGADHAVLEVSSHALDQRRTDGLRFDTAVFTNLSGDHLDYHGSMDAYLRAKRRLFDGLGEDATAIINFDDPAGELIASNLRANVLSFGLDAQTRNIRAQITSLTVSGSRFKLCTPSDETEMECPLLGRHNVANVLAAVGAASALGIGTDAMRTAVRKFDAVPGRLQSVQPAGCPFSVIVDYAHSDDALRNALVALRPLTKRRLICVFGCGGDRDRGKRPRMARVVGQLADVAYVTSDNPRTECAQRIIDDILPGFGPKPNASVETHVDRRVAIEKALAGARPGDTVLIAGKGHETYQLVGDAVLDFDDARVAREFLGGKVTAGAA